MNGAIFRRLNSSQVAQMLAKFNGEPAIFYQKAPDDVHFIDDNYPQIVFQVDKFSDTIHGAAGLLTVEIICKQTDSPPETLEKLLRRSLEGIFFAPVDGEIFQLKWQRTDTFREPASEQMPLIIGAEIVFEIREFPSAETINPDPIAALNDCAARFDELIVIGTTPTEEIFEPTIERPAVRFDIQRTRMTGQTHAAVWLETLATGHVFAPNVTSRRTWCNFLAQVLMKSPAIFLRDSSPMRVTACEINFAADEIQGQIQVTLEYNLLKTSPYAHPLIGKIFNFDEVLKCTQPLN